MTPDVLVTGDATLTWHVLRAGDGPAASDTAESARMLVESGGAPLLARLIEAVSQGSGAAVRIDAGDWPAGEMSPLDSRHHHVFIEWVRQGKPPAWRVSRMLGRQPRSAPGPPGARSRAASSDRVVALYDGALGFRNEPDAWPSIDDAWVVIEMARPIADGALWRHLHERCAERLVAVIAADDLRAAPAQISRDASWERTAQDAAWELQHNPRVAALAACAIVVVSFGPEGALVLERRAGRDADATLFFDPPATDGASSGQAWWAMGGTTCVTAAIAAAIARRPESPDIHAGIRGAIAGLRALQAGGYEGEPAEAPARFGFPVARVADAIARGDAPIAVAPVRRPGSAQRWSILTDRVGGGFDELAARVAVEGPDASLRDVPIGRFGRLVTIDRQEIESYRAIRSLIADYCASALARPLSIAVFGAPGSGKSFGVKQVAAAALGDRKPLEFNLSQFDGPDGLRGALHQVRDVALSGKVPLVFWDEFDTALGGEPLGWLRHFLSPMQDGSFLEGQIVHPIGRAVFVFAGGTAARMRDFGRTLAAGEFVRVKGPDFVSRLRGSLDVLGPNPQPGESHADPYSVIRRALLLRGLLLQHAPACFDGQRLRIDPGVLRGFLETREFRHGARSMEAIITSSRLAGCASYDRSALPPDTMLDLHVRSADFMAVVHRLELAGDTLEALARAGHAVFLEMMQRRDYVSGAETDDRKKTHSSVRPYDELPEDEKAQNRDAVRDIPRKLALAGYVMVPARGGEPDVPFTSDEVDRLAEIEHERWSNLKFAGGWEYAPETDKPGKRHSALRPWSELPEEEREKDRELVRKIPRILAVAGYTAIREASE